MSEPSNRLAEEYATSITELGAQVLLAAKKAQETLRQFASEVIAAEARRHTMAEGVDALRYRLRLLGEERKAKRFLETEVRAMERRINDEGLAVKWR